MAYGQKLGANQVACLKALCRVGQWPGGWLWNGEHGTIKILDSLVRRGYAERREPDPAATYYSRIPRFYPTEAGRAALADLRALSELPAKRR